MYGIEELIKTEKRLFHLADMAVVWQISNRKTLNMRLYRYVKRGLLFSIQRGLYSLVPPDKLSPLEVAIALNHGYCYLTTETVLEKHGVINRRVQFLTFIGEKSRKYCWGENQFMFRKLKTEYLMRNDGIVEENGYFTASLERAVADILYFIPKFYFDSPNLINWARVEEIKKKVGYK